MLLIDTLYLSGVDITKEILALIAIILYIICSYIFHLIIFKVSAIDIFDLHEIGVFNSREISIFICIIIPFFIIYIRSNSTRDSVKKVFEAFFVKDIIIVLVLAILHFLIIIAILNSIGFWEVSLLKDTLLWLVFSASVTIFSVNRGEKDNSYFLNTIIDNFKFSAIVGFITSQYTFNIFVEILITAISFFIVALLAFSKEEKYKDVKNLLNIITVIISGVLLYHSIYEIIHNLATINPVEKSKEFSLPIILTFWFIPFIYILYIYMNYEMKFVAMKFAIEDKDALKYAKREALITFRNDLDSLKRWVNTLYIDGIKTKEDVIESIIRFKELKTVEQNPPTVDSSEGWSPYTSKDFLKVDKIETGPYNRCFDDEWQASSLSINLNDTVITEDGKYYGSDNVAYYVSGNRNIANQLKLILHINSDRDEKISVNKFHTYVKSLYTKSMNRTLPIQISQSIIGNRKKDVSLKVCNKNVTIERHPYVNGIKGYALSFTIKYL